MNGEKANSAKDAYGCFMHVPPVQLSPIEHECPQLPQLLLSEMNDESLTHDPMQEV